MYLDSERNGGADIEELTTITGTTSGITGGSSTVVTVQITTPLVLIPCSARSWTIPGSLPLIAAVMRAVGRFPTAGLARLGRGHLCRPCLEMGIAFVCWLHALRLDTTCRPSCSSWPFLSLLLLRWLVGEPSAAATPIGLLLIISALLPQQIRARK